MTVHPHAVPFETEGDPGSANGRTGVLLSHGFTGSPVSMRPWADHLAAQGYAVSVPLLPGHGTRWQDLNKTTWADWSGEVERAFTALAARVDTVFVFGLSMGGALALRLAADHPDRVAGLVLVNPAVTTERKDVKLLPVLKLVIPSFPGIADDIKKPGVEEYGYKKTPLRAAHSMFSGLQGPARGPRPGDLPHPGAPLHRGPRRGPVERARHPGLGRLVRRAGADAREQLPRGDPRQRRRADLRGLERVPRAGRRDHLRGLTRSMSPHDPDEEAPRDDVSAEDAAWRSIVDNYGDRPEIEDAEVAPPTPTAGAPRGAGASRLPADPEDHFRPPPPPPLPLPGPPRLLAWLGLFGVPTLVLVLLVAGVDLPTWMGLVLMVWFVGGFVYLVASMRPGSGDDYDDGAVL